MKKNIDIIIDSNGVLTATAVVGQGYRIAALPGHTKHRVEIAASLIDKKSGAEIHQAIANLLYFEEGVAKLKPHSK